MKTLIILLSAVAVVLGAAGCATYTGSARSGGYNTPSQVWTGYGSKVGH